MITWLRNGVTREVFLTKRYAFKIPKLRYGWRMFLHGLICNMQEAGFGRTGWPEVCPVLFAIPGGWLVVMPRCRPLSDIEWQTFDPYAFRVKPDYHIPVEPKWCSFGILNDRIVAVDYGS
jgi:hypothetical protein